MSIEIDDLAALQDAYLEAARGLESFISHKSPAERKTFIPHYNAEPALLDAWADYMIAKRRYERALIASRRGSVEYPQIGAGLNRPVSQIHSAMRGAR